MAGARRVRTLRQRRRRDRWGSVAVALLAVAAGVIAGHFGTRRAWERPTTGSTTPTSVQVQGRP